MHFIISISCDISGLLHTAGHQFAQADVVEEEDEHPEAKFYKSRMDRHTAPPMSGRTPIYDFDEWSRAHYGATFERANRARARYRMKVERLERDKIDIKNETVIMGLMGFLVVFLIISYLNKNDYDTVERNENIKNTK